MANQKRSILKKVLDKTTDVAANLVPSTAIKNVDTYLKKQGIKQRYQADLPPQNNFGREDVSRAIDKNNYSRARKLMRGTLSTLINWNKDEPMSTGWMKNKLKKYKNS